MTVGPRPAVSTVLVLVGAGVLCVLPGCTLGSSLTGYANQDQLIGDRDVVEAFTDGLSDVWLQDPTGTEGGLGEGPPEGFVAYSAAGSGTATVDGLVDSVTERLTAAGGRVACSTPEPAFPFARICDVQDVGPLKVDGEMRVSYTVAPPADDAELKSLESSEQLLNVSLEYWVPS